MKDLINIQTMKCDMCFITPSFAFADDCLNLTFGFAFLYWGVRIEVAKFKVSIVPRH